MKNNILSIYSWKIRFPEKYDVRELEKHFTSMIVFSKLMGYVISDSSYNIDGEEVYRLDFDRKDVTGFTVEIIYEKNKQEVHSVDFFYKDEDHIYLVDNIESMILNIERLVNSYI